MKIRVFASLKEYFEPEFELDAAAGNVEELKVRLGEMRPAAIPLLDCCRFAVADRFVDAEYLTREYETVAVIPPASGG